MDLVGFGVGGWVVGVGFLVDLEDVFLDHCDRE